MGKVLIVEDTEIGREMLGKLLSNLKLAFDEAENGQVAVNYFKSGKTYDLVFMDKQMPVMDGHEATRQLRSLGVKTPIIALTTNTSPSDKSEFLTAGADVFITKPISRHELVQLLKWYRLL